jgi:hypothetical protein
MSPNTGKSGHPTTKNSHHAARGRRGEEEVRTDCVYVFVASKIGGA